VLAAVMVALNKDTSWASANKEMGDGNFLNKLKTYDANEMSVKTLQNLTKRYVQF
jgi:hypothetical protein